MGTLSNSDRPVQPDDDDADDTDATDDTGVHDATCDHCGGVLADPVAWYHPRDDDLSVEVDLDDRLNLHTATWNMVEGGKLWLHVWCVVPFAVRLLSDVRNAKARLEEFRVKFLEDLVAGR